MFRVQSSELGLSLGFRVQDSGFMDQGLGVAQTQKDLNYSLAFRVQG